MCFYGKRIPNRRYKKNKKNGGIVPVPFDDRLKWINADCGECMACRKKIQREWQVRLMEEVKELKNGKFITLTFNTESLKKIAKELGEIDGYKRDNAIAKYAVRHWLERWRKQFGKSARHWLITELGHGQTEHLHLHGIIWTNQYVKWKSGKGKKRKEEWIKGTEAIERTWQYGWVWKGYSKNGIWENYVNAKTVNYIIKYVSKMDIHHPSYKPKILCSPGIGASYITSEKYLEQYYKGEETYRTETGHKIAIPTYWKNKIYSEIERERLWIEKLDKEERYIMGEKYKWYEESDMLKYWQRRNVEAGFGYGKKDEEQEEWERQRRNTIWTKRTS